MAIDSGISTGVNVGVDASAAQQGAQQFNNAMQSMGIAAELTVSKIKRTLSDIGDSLTSLKGILAEVGIAMEFRNLVQTNVMFARWQVMLQAVAGSAESGTVEMEWLNKEVDTLGLRLSIAAEQYIQMTAAAKDTNQQGEATRKIFHALSEELTVMHAGPEQVSRAMMQVREMMSIGNITMQHMKYLATSIPDVFDLASKGLGVSQTKLHDMMKEGLKATVFFPALAKAMDDRYAAGALKAADMTQALMNRVANSWTRLLGQVNEGGFGAAFDDALRHVIEILSSPDIRAAARMLGDQLASAIKLGTDAMVFLAAHSAEVVVALKALIALKIVGWVGSLTRDITYAVEAFQRLTAAAITANAAVTGAKNLPRSLGAAAATPATTASAVQQAAAIAPAFVPIPKQSPTEVLGTSSSEELKEWADSTKNVTKNQLEMDAALVAGQGPMQTAIRMGEENAKTVKKDVDAIRQEAKELNSSLTPLQAATVLGGRRGQVLAEGVRDSAKAADAARALQLADAALTKGEFEVATGAGVMTAQIATQTATQVAAQAKGLSVIQMLKNMSAGAMSNVKAWGMMVLTAPLNLFKSLAAGAASLATGLYAAADGLLAMMAANPFTTLLVAITAALVALYEFRDTVINTKNTHAEVRDYIVAVWVTIKNTIVGAYKTAESATKEFGDYVIGFFGENKDRMTDPMKKPFQEFNNWYDNEFLGGILGRVNRFVDAFTPALEAAADRQRKIREYNTVRENVPSMAFTPMPTGVNDGFIPVPFSKTSETLMSGEGLQDLMGKDANTIKAMMNMPQTKGKGIGPFDGKDEDEAKRDRYADMMRKIQDETAMIDKEDEVYRRYTGTIHNLTLEISLLAAAHKGLQEYLSLPIKDRTESVKDPKTGKTTVVDRLQSLVDANQREARAKNEEDHDKAVHGEIETSELARQQELLMAQAQLEGAHAVMVATEVWKEYDHIKKQGITDQYSIAQLNKETDAVIAQKTALETQAYYKTSVEPLVYGHKQEEEDYNRKMQYLMNLRQAALDNNRDIGISDKELAVLEEQLDEAELARQNQWRMETKDGLQGLLAAQSEVAEAYKDHAKQMHDIYMKNMDAFQSTLDEFIATGKAHWSQFFDGLQKDIIHQITTNTIMPHINDAFGSLFGGVDKNGDATTGFFGGILAKVFGKDNGPWNEQVPGKGNKNFAGLHPPQMSVTAQVVNVRAAELTKDGKIKNDVIDLMKNPTDAMTKAADENGVVWENIAKDVGVKFTSAADTINSVMQSIQQGKNEQGGGILGTVLNLAGSFLGAGLGAGLSASDTQLGTLPSAGNNIPSMTGVALPPPEGMAFGGIMTSRGVLNLRRYAGGGIAMANNPQAAIFGEGDMNEAFVPLPDGRSIPVRMTGKGRNAERHYHMENHFHFPNATVDAFRKSRDQIAADMGLIQQAAMAKIT